MKNKSRKRKQIMISAAIVICVAAIVAGCFIKNAQDREALQIGNISMGSGANAESSVVHYKGKAYQYNQNLMNVLFLGIDTTQDLSQEDMPGDAGQSDCILVLSMDKQKKTARLLQVSRDTMTDIDTYDVSGNYVSTIQGQLALQYAYGTGGKSSCWAAKKTVSRLLYDLPIDAYFSMNLDGISAVNDAVGGVTLKLSEDATEVDPTFKKGSTITLQGDMAEQFVRKRDTNISGSNVSRMKRQTEYITTLLQSMREFMKQNGNDFEETYRKLELRPYTVTDLSMEQLEDMLSYDFLEKNIETVPGTTKEGKEHDEFYVDEDGLHDLIIQMFYTEVKE